MTRADREQARRIEAYLDEIVERRRVHGNHERRTADDEELAGLRGVVDALAELEVAPPAGFQDALLQQISDARADESDARSWRERVGFMFGSWRRLAGACWTIISPPGISLRTALATIVAIAAGGLAFRAFVATPIVSAQEILSRSDAVLANLVRPGQVLYRRWHLVTVTSTPTIAPYQSRRIVDEWMDGSDPDRVAGRWSTPEGQTLTAYTTRLQSGEHRPYVYFASGAYGEMQSVLNIEPTRREFDQAVARFPFSVQRALRVYLDRQYIYMPITGERRFNRSIIEDPRPPDGAMARMIVSLDDSSTPDGAPAYRVRVVDPALIRFNWRSDGPPRVRVGTAEIVRYIARESYLSVRMEETSQLEDGTRMFTTRELVETRAVSASEIGFDPFTLEIPPGTPTHVQSAFEHLSGVAAALDRLPRVRGTWDSQAGPSHNP